MFISQIFKKIIGSPSKKEVIKTCIENLHIDQTQKNLFLGSLDFLDDEGLVLLYERITGFLDQILEQNQSLKMKQNKEEREKIHTKEYNDDIKEKNSFKILLDTI